MNKKHPLDWVCPECLIPGRKHMAKDLCERCYLKFYKRRKRAESGAKPRPDWKKFSHCIDCGSTVIDSHGRCSRCYKKWFRRTFPDLCRQRQRVFEHRHSFGGNPGVISRRENGNCEKCGMTSEQHKMKWGISLSVHHIDGKGAKSEHPNHSPSNLMILCKRCHRSIHWEIQEVAL